jgi:hypothetical protein
MDGRHPEQPPRRAAQPISSAESGERSVAARRSWAAPGLSSGRLAAAVTVIRQCIGGVLVAPLCFIYIRITLGTVSFERKGVWAVEQSYGVLLYA